MIELTAEQKQQLEDLLVKLTQDINSKAREGLELSMNRDRDGGRDSLDESTQEELISTELRFLDREKKLLSKIRAAQERMESGEINQCEDCDGPIGFKRLIVRPVTTLCIECKEAREAEEAASDGSVPRGDELEDRPLRDVDAGLADLE